MPERVLLNPSTEAVGRVRRMSAPLGVIAELPDTEDSSAERGQGPITEFLPENLPLLDIMHVLFTREEESITALCLEWDIAAQGDSINQAREALAEAFELQREALLDGTTNVFGSPSPKEDWKRFEDAQPIDPAYGLQTLAVSVDQRLLR